MIVCYYDIILAYYTIYLQLSSHGFCFSGLPVFIFLALHNMTWYLSKSVPMVFKSQRNALIKLFHFIFNSKCHFSKVRFFV